MADNELTSEGTRLVKDWLGAKERLEKLKREVTRAECDLSNTQTALAKWMLPQDAKPGEKIAVWHHDSLIQVEVPLQSHMPAPITVRLRGRQLSSH